MGLPRSRLESLLSSFPRLLSPTSEHTVLEASGVRFLYTPLEDLYVLLITNPGSNILLDLGTLSLCTRLVTELASGGRGGAVAEDDVKRVAFDVLEAWDEVVTLGWRENVNLGQVRSTLEMESHEEKIQEIIARVRIRACPPLVTGPPCKTGRTGPSSWPSTHISVVYRTRSKRLRKNSSAAPSNWRFSVEKCLNAANPPIRPITLLLALLQHPITTMGPRYPPTFPGPVHFRKQRLTGQLRVREAPRFSRPKVCN